VFIRKSWSAGCGLSAEGEPSSEVRVKDSELYSQPLPPGPLLKHPDVFSPAGKRPLSPCRPGVPFNTLTPVIILAARVKGRANNDENYYTNNDAFFCSISGAGKLLRLVALHTCALRQPAVFLKYAGYVKVFSLKSIDADWCFVIE
jgi:hypothetical protein